jgi:uncharacterized membrane protein
LASAFYFRRRLLEAENAPEEAGERETWLRWSAKRTDYLDGSMIFGPPILGFGLQCALIQHIEFGMAFSALLLGVFYLVLALFLRRVRLGQVILLTEICLALGVVFGTLAIPLALDAQWTSAAWAVEGAGLYWLGLRQSRPLSRAFAFFLILAAAQAYFNQVGYDDDTLLSGSPLGAAMLGAAMLFVYQALLQALPEQRSDVEANYCQPILAVAGLCFFYLIAPLYFDVHLTVVCWALAGLLTFFIGLRLESRPFLLCALGVQLFGGLIFLLKLSPGMGGRVLYSGWLGLFCAALLGFTLIVSAFLAQRNLWAQEQSKLSKGFALALLTGLVFLNLAALFVLDWTHTSAAWAISGLVIFCLGHALRLRLAFYFGLLLEAAGGFAFFLDGQYRYFAFAPESTPFLHVDFWAPATLALAALIASWRLHRVARLAPESTEYYATEPFFLLSGLLLAWGIGWWVWAAAFEIYRFYMEGFAPLALAALSLSAGLWALWARREQWQGMALAALLPLAAASVLLLRGEGSLLAYLGLWIWPLFFCLHFFILRLLAALLPKQVPDAAHVLGCWLLIGVLALSLHDVMLRLSEAQNAWRWLGWALVPSLYLILVSSKHRLFWPIAAFERAYRLHAALPVALVLMLWFWFANLFSNGASDPLPYLPLVNPLELGLLIVLVTGYRWSFTHLPESATTLRRGARQLAGVSLLALLTLSVCRSAHHWDGIAFHPDALFASMSVQAGWSLIWTLYALALMIGGNRKKSRVAWMTGAALVGTVVVKLFFVELGNSGSLARIISFIGVGALLLIVGYFSPLPPRVEEGKPESDTPP